MMAGIATSAAALGLKTRRPTRAEVTEHVLTQISRGRALTEGESLLLEAAIDEQVNLKRDKRGRRHPSRYLSCFAGKATP